MKNFALHGTALVLSAALVSLVVAYLAHTVLNVPRYVIRADALGMAACLAGIIVAGMFARRRG
jgi:hypothetical protein